MDKPSGIGKETEFTLGPVQEVAATSAHYVNESPPDSYGELLKKSMNLAAIQAAKFKNDLKRKPRAVSARGKARAGRNHLCPCGSGKKYKRCCLNS